MRIDEFHKSINESDFTEEQINIIWDFYVTKSIAGSAAQKRNVRDYGISTLPIKNMLNQSTVESNRIKILPATSISEITTDFKLDPNDDVEIDHLGIVCLTPFFIESEQKPKKRYGDAESILTHIRNAFAHGNTYFFNNGNVLLTDKDNRGKLTASILIKQQTLIDWIKLIDSNEIFYVLHNVEEIENGKDS